MKMFSDCSGECALCACGGFCLAGHGDDDYYPARPEQIIERLNKAQYPNYKDLMIQYLKQYGITYNKDDYGKDKEYEKPKKESPTHESFAGYSYNLQKKSGMNRNER